MEPVNAVEERPIDCGSFHDAGNGAAAHPLGSCFYCTSVRNAGRVNSAIYDALRSEAAPGLVAAFSAYHKRHPEVWSAFKRYSSEMRSSGRKKYSAWAIINRIRWDHDIKRTEEFKIANGYIALYARVLMRVDPSFVGFFETRPMKPGLAEAAHD